MEAGLPVQRCLHVVFAVQSGAVLEAGRLLVSRMLIGPVGSQFGPSFEL